jgi:hypothetical protein
MSWKAEANRIYEQRVLADALARLAARLDRGTIPLSDAELATLAKRARAALRNPEKKGERLARYQAHLAKSYGIDAITAISKVLEEVLNEIGYEEK